MKKKLVLISFLLFGISLLRADEGKWLMMFLDKNMKEMKAKGLKLNASDIYNVNKSSLKDAIVQFGNGCTGEIISKEGLLLTNHHCGFGQIQAHSTVTNDYLQNGFWAYSKDQELPNPGLSVKILVRMEDVSKEVLAELKPDMTEKERAEKVNEISTKIVQRSTENTHYNARVAEMYEGNEYYLFVYETFKDIRLVGAPPYSIGKFGGDTDNWMWPRHTGDFSLFRIYMAPDGKPANYSKDNVPYKPKHYLPISVKGVKENDFTMILGYPGSTNRFATSFDIQTSLEVKNPSIVNARQHKLDVMRKHMNADRAVGIQYASKYAQTANYWKYFIGQSKGLERLNVMGKKQDLEKRFSEWVAADSKRQERYGNTLKDLEETSNLLRPTEYFTNYFVESIFRGPEVFGIALQFKALASDLKEGKTESVKKNSDRLKERVKDLFKDYDLATDQELMEVCLELFFKNVPIKDQPASFLDLAFKNGYDFKKIAEELYTKTIFNKPEKLQDFLNSPDENTITSDPVFILEEAFFDQYKSMMNAFADTRERAGKAKRELIAGLREMDKNTLFSPDANSTMRLSYGQVLPYRPADGIIYDYTTTMDGVIQKENPASADFQLPEKLKELYQKKTFGRWGNNGTLIVNFISNNDITGGNSGSPVINGKGELIGCAFDGNWEAMSGDIAFEPYLQRTICLDVRYILFIIEQYAGAKNLIDELTIVK